MQQFSKNEIVERLVERTGVKKALAAQMVNETFTIIREIICQEGAKVKLAIRDFGVFEVHKTGSRQNARDPRTNRPIKVGPRKRILFRPGKYLKEFLKRPL